MMKQVVIVLGIIALALANGKPCKNGENGKNGEHHHPEPTEAVFGGAIKPWMPFPHFEGFALYETADGLTLLPGSAFVKVNDDGSCHRVSLTEEAGGYCPMNQTICNQIAATKCAPEVANATCFEPSRPGQTPAPGTPTNIPEAEFGNGYLYGGPLCYVEALGFKFQPTAYTSIHTMAPKIQTCVFDVAPAPTVFPEPTGEPVHAADPPCPFIEM